MTDLPEETSLSKKSKAELIEWVLRLGGRVQELESRESRLDRLSDELAVDRRRMRSTQTLLAALAEWDPDLGAESAWQALARFTRWVRLHVAEDDESRPAFDIALRVLRGCVSGGQVPLDDVSSLTTHGLRNSLAQVIEDHVQMLDTETWELADAICAEVERVGLR